DVSQHVHVSDESSGQFAKDFRKGVLVAPAEGSVGVLTHGDVVVHVDRPAAKAVGEKPGHEQRAVAEAAKPHALFAAAGLQSTRQLDGQWFFVQGPAGSRVGTDVLTEQVDQVVRGQVARFDVLASESGFHELLEVLD